MTLDPDSSDYADMMFLRRTAAGNLRAARIAAHVMERTEFTRQVGDLIAELAGSARCAAYAAGLMEGRDGNLAVNLRRGVLTVKPDGKVSVQAEGMPEPFVISARYVAAQLDTENLDNLAVEFVHEQWGKTDDYLHGFERL